MKRRIALAASVLALAMTFNAYAKGDSYSNPQQSPGVMGSESDKMKEDTAAAKQKLAPHAITIQTELQSALDSVKGLKTQLQVAEAPTRDFIDHYKLHSKDISKDMSTVATHDGHLKSEVSKFPSVAKMDEYKAIGPAIDEAQKINQSFQQKSSNVDYWKNKNEALSDLDRLENQLNNALKKTKSFSSKLDISSVG